MEKVALIGDIHFDRKSEKPIIKKYVREGQRKFFDFIAKDLKERGIKTIISTGDLHHNRNIIDVEALVYTKRLLQETLKDFDVHIVLGNHDMYYEQSYEITALELLENIPNVTVYRKSVTSKKFLGKDWFLFPWITKDIEEKRIQDFKRWAELKDKTANTIFFGHFEILGINMEGKEISITGMDKNLFLNAARLTLSGHYHGHSYKKSGENELIYLGSPYPMTFANADQKHGIWVLDEEFKMEFIENTISPQFTDIWDIDLDKIEDRDLTNSFVRFYMQDGRSAEEAYECKLKIESKKPLVINPIPYKGEKAEVEQKEETAEEANKVLSMDTPMLSKKYVEINQADLPELKLTDDSEKAVLDKIDKYDSELNL